MKQVLRKLGIYHILTEIQYNRATFKCCINQENVLYRIQLEYDVRFQDKRLMYYKIMNRKHVYNTKIHVNYARE